MAATLPLGWAAVRGRRSTAAWVVAVLACSVADWLDGPLARRAGTAGPAGAWLDLEADSWLTLWTAVAACRTRSLGWWCLVAPVARYAVAGPWRPRPPGREALWRRLAGASQMAVLLAALSPSAGLRNIARGAAPVGAAIALAALIAPAQKRASTRVAGGVVSK